MSFLRTGQLFRVKGVQHRCDRQLPNGKYVAINEESGEPRVWTTEELVQLLESAQLDFLTDSEAGKRGFNPALIDFNQIKGTPRERTERRAAYLRVMDKIGHERSKADMQAVINEVAKQINDPCPPHISTVYSWLAKWIAGGRDIRALLAKTHKRGNRSTKLSSKTFQIINLVINEIYLVRPRKSVKTVHAHVKVRVQEYNKSRTLDQQIEEPSEATVRREIAKRDPYDVCVARFGKRSADYTYKMIGRGPRAKRILHRVGVDHTTLDLFVICSRTGVVLGKPTLTIAVDQFSRMIIGVYVGFEVPSGLAVSNCLRNAFLSKGYVKERYPEIENVWPCYGKWENAIFDNGSDFHSKNIEAVLASIGTNPHFMPVRSPEFKGWVERIFRTINEDLIHELEGTTSSSPAARGDYKAEKHACIPMEILELLIHRWIIDDYPYRVHSDLKERPIDVWNRSADEYPPAPAFRHISDLDPLTAGTGEATLSNRGIKFEGIIYSGPTLQKLVVQQGKKHKKHEFRYDPSDLSHIAVLDPVTLQYVPVPSTNPEYTKDLTLWAHKTIKKITAAKYESRRSDKWAEIRVWYSDIVEECKREAARLRRTFSARLARFQGESVKPIGLSSHLAHTPIAPALPAPVNEKMPAPLGAGSFDAPASNQAPLSTDDELDDESEIAFNTFAKVTFDD